MRRYAAVPLLLAALAAPASAGTTIPPVLDPTRMPPPCPVRPIVYSSGGTTYLNIPGPNCTWITIPLPIASGPAVV